jgi:hypothetical protein
VQTNMNPHAQGGAYPRSVPTRRKRLYPLAFQYSVRIQVRCHRGIAGRVLDLTLPRDFKRAPVPRKHGQLRAAVDATFLTHGYFGAENLGGARHQLRMLAPAVGACLQLNLVSPVDFKAKLLFPFERPLLYVLLVKHCRFLHGHKDSGNCACLIVRRHDCGIVDWTCRC